MNSNTIGYMDIVVAIGHAFVLGGLITYSYPLLLQYYGTLKYLNIG